MVSTRGIRYRFSEGERVLCYEPDPTKAKVLYDSKVLEVIEGKDKRGRRTIEYLIHFQGWNSSWDRCVGEDFVLKDTEENRQLQRDLAEKSQLQLGAYLYRRERKKISNPTASAGAAKRARQGFSDDGSSSSTQPDEAETGDTDSSSGGSSHHARQGRAHLQLPSALRDRLTFDYHLVVKRGRLSKLPASPCAAEILESFVKWFARAGAWTPQRGRHDPPQKPDMLDVSCRLNLVREVADGLRVYFDFVLRGHLLYKQELYQYQEICGQFIETTTDEDDEEEEKESRPVKQNGHASNQPSGEQAQEFRNVRTPEYAHLPPDPAQCDRTLRDTQPVPERNNHENSNHDSNQNDTEQKNGPPSEENHTDGAKENNIKEENCVGACTRSGNVARRLRSHKSVVSQSENEEPVPSTSAVEPRAASQDTLSSSVGSSGSSLSECWARPTQSSTTPSSTRTPLSLLFDKVAKWQIIPREGTENLPCRIYGAIHLARLFVKLPDFLNATQMPDFKLKLILKHIEMFVQYLDEHSEWFGEMYYTTDSISRPH